jgi:hypothetical protein
LEEASFESREVGAGGGRTAGVELEVEEAAEGREETDF